MNRTCYIDWTIERGEESTDVCVQYKYKAGLPARTYGLPEDCYPAEAAEIEFQKANLILEHKPFSNWPEVDLTEEEYDAIESHILDNPPDTDHED